MTHSPSETLNPQSILNSQAPQGSPDVHSALKPALQPPVLWEVDLQNFGQSIIPDATTHILIDPLRWNDLETRKESSASKQPALEHPIAATLIELQKKFPRQATVALLCHPQWLNHEAFERADAYYIPGPHCRQGDLLSAAASTAKPLFVERGSFLAPNDFQHAIERTRTGSSKAGQLTLIDAGSHFGYGDRVLDPRSLVLLSSWRERFGISFALSFTDLIGSESSASEYRPRWLEEKVFSDMVFKIGALWNCGLVFKKHPLWGFQFLDDLLTKAELAIEYTNPLRQVSHALKSVSFEFNAKRQKREPEESR